MLRLATTVVLFGSAAGEEREDLIDFLKELGHPESSATAAADKVCDFWPGSHAEAVESRRMKALHWLQIANKDDIRDLNLTQDRRLLTSPPICANLGHAQNHNCKDSVIWGQRDGRWQPEASIWYHDLMRFTGMPYTTASLEDFQKASWCGMAEQGHECGLPPCSCSYPPCDICRPGDGEPGAAPAPPPTVHDLGFEAQCAAHDGCVDQDGDCCPNHHGRLETCCGFIPPHEAVGEPVFDSYPAVPGEDEIAALDNGRYLGPLPNTVCSRPEAAAEAHEHVTLPECSGLCTRAPNCIIFTFRLDGTLRDGKCKLYAESNRRYGTCRMDHTEDGTALFVKNKDGMSPHKLPTEDVSGSKATFMAIGDWGSISCPGRASMHYLRPVPTGSDEWLIDHHAQENVANVMRKLSKITKPFAVINVGDNFYWGGIPHKARGGKGIHDHIWAVNYENVYSDEELMVPWLGVVGNHDYGGDGCFSDIRAQFDYTIKDLVYNKRWKMPSPYYSKKYNFDGFSAEMFMVDSNMEDSHNGRHGGICAQHLCEPEKVVDEQVCQQWFVNLLQEQETWLESALAASTAEWKIIGVHHKPMGFISRSLMPLVMKYNVQIMISGHTHETSFFENWPILEDGRPLLVVGAGGGAQGRPGCGHGMWCGKDQDYSLANIGIAKDALTITIHKHDETTLFTTYVSRDGSVSSEAPAGEVVTPPTPLRESPAPPPLQPGQSAHHRPAPRPAPAPHHRWVPPSHPHPRPAPAPSPPPMDTEGACACDESGTIRGIDTHRPGCKSHLGRQFGDFCYVSGTHCSGSKFSRRVGLFWRRCSTSMVV